MTLALRLRSGWAKRSRQEQLVYRLLLPVFVPLFFVATLPFLIAVYESLTSSGAFVGLANFERALGNPALYTSPRQTAIYGLIVLPTEILLCLLIPLFLP